MAVEAPRVELSLSIYFFSDTLLEELDSALLDSIFKPILNPVRPASDLEQDFLVVEVDIKFKKILSRQLLYPLLIHANLVLHSDNFIVALHIQFSPQLFNFIHPFLMGDVAGLVGRLASGGLQMLVGPHGLSRKFAAPCQERRCELFSAVHS